MVFKVGCRYEHIGTHERMLIIAETDISFIYSVPMLIGEMEDGTLKPIGIGDDYAVNWKQIFPKDGEK